MKNEPGICKLVEKAAKGWAISNDITIKNIPQFQSETDKAQFLLETEEAKSVVLKYADWLVTTCNEAMPNDSWNLPSPHPCAVSLHNVTDLDEDYHNLVNTVERHTRCNAAYCLRQQNVQHTPQCRFRYP